VLISCEFNKKLSDRNCKTVKCAVFLIHFIYTTMKRRKTTKRTNSIKENWDWKAYCFT